MAVIRGLNFQQGATVTFGAKAVDSVKFVDAQTLTVVTPAGGAGPVNVEVSNPDGQSTTFTGGFTYQDSTAPAPIVSAIQPNTGPAGGGTYALVTGDKFQEGAILFVGRSPASEVVVASALALSGRLPSGEVGPADVEVTNPDGQTGALKQGFAYSSDEGVGPTLAGTTPMSGPAAGGAGVTLSGTNLQSGALVLFGGRPAAGVSAVGTSGVALTATTPAVPAGVADVAVTNPDGRSDILRGAYDFYVSGPVVTGVAPSFGPPTGGTGVTIQGRFFDPKASVNFGGKTLGGLTWVDAQTLTGTTPAAPAGAVDITVANPDGQSDTLSKGFNYGTGTFNSTLAVTRVVPENGPNTGGTRITIIGNAFASGAQVLVGGQPATNVTVLGGTSLVAVTPAGQVGPAEVDVTVGTNVAKLPNGFWYFDRNSKGAAPQISSVAPSSGPSNGGSLVLISGKNFQQGAKAFFGQSAASSTRFVSSTVLSAITPAGAAGPVDVHVQNPDGQIASLSSSFVYVDGSQLGEPPGLVSVTPNSGGTVAPTPVSLATVNAQAGALIFVDGIPASAVNVVSGTAVTASFPPDKPGTVDVSITNPDGQTATLTGGFTYVLSPPTVLSVSPSTVPLDGGVQLLVSGTGFQAGATAAVDTTSGPAVVVDSTLLAFPAPPHAPGLAALTVTNPDGQSSTLDGGITYANIQLGAPPTLSSVYPASGPSTGGTVVLLQGSNFLPGAKVLFGSALAAKAVVMASGRMSAEAPPGAVGAVDVVVLNPDGQSAQLPKSFTYVDPSTLGPAPVLQSVTPAQGIAAGGTQTILTGSGFQNQMLAFFGGFTASSSTVQNGGIATAVTPPGPQGTVDVAVTNPDGQSSILAGGYVYVPAPQPQAIAPAQGPTTGGTSFTLAGTGFAAGAKVYFGNAGATGIAVQSATVITGSTPAYPAGPADVTVVNADGQQGTLDGGFTFDAPPVVKLLKPGAGPTAGGTSVLITGNNFTSGATVTFGTQAAASVQIIDPQTVLAVTPAGAVGPVDVTLTNPDGQKSVVTQGYNYEIVDASAQRQASYPAGYALPLRDDAQFHSDLGIANLSSAGVNVTLDAVDGTGTVLASRALTVPVPPFGRTVIKDVLQFITAATSTTNLTASVVLHTDGPVAAYAMLIDKMSGDSSTLLAEPASRGAAQLFVPYASSVGAYKTWLFIRNLGSSGATVSITARDGSGAQLGLVNATVPAGGFYSNDDLFGTMNVSNAVASLELDASGGTILAAARTYSNVVRLGGMVAARPASDAASAQVLGYVPDLSGETSSIFLVNPDPANTANATLTLRAQDGSIVGTKSVTVAPKGLAQVPDLARTLLGKTTPTQTISSVRATADRPLLGMGLLLNTSNSDFRFYQARAAGGVRLIEPAPNAATSLAVTNDGSSTATVEISLRGDTGTPRGTVIRLAIPAGGQFNAAALLASMGAGTGTGVVEVRSITGQPLAGVAKIGSDVNGATGDGMDLGNVLTIPALDSVTPGTGPATGGTMAQLLGQYFLPGASVLFGGALAPQALVSADSTAVAVSPAGPAGTTVPVSLINLDGSAATLSGAFAYVDPNSLGTPPSLAAVTPQQISTLGGTAIQLSGSNFSSNPLVFVGLAPATGVTQVNPSQLNAAAPPGPVGPANVTVTNADGQSSTLTGGVQYVVPPPSLTSVTPGTGPAVGGTQVVIAGNGFQTGATVFFGGNSANNVTVVSAQEIDCAVPAGNDGPAALVVTNPDGQSATLNNAFTYVAAPQVSSVSPTSGPTAGGTSIQISGRYFRAGATVTIGTTAATNVVVQPGGQVINCTTPAGTAGPAAVVVTNADGQKGTLNNGFTYLAPIPPPAVTAVSPNYGPTSGGTQVTISGAAFQAGAVVFFGANKAPSANVISPSAIIATTPGAGAQGAVNVTVTNPDSQSSTLINGFSYYQPGNLPAIAVTSLTPNQGPPAGGNSVFISGQGFKAGVAVTFSGTPATSVTYIGPSALSVVVPAHAAGPVNVTATNTDATTSTLANGYLYQTAVSFAPSPMRLPASGQRGYSNFALFDADNNGTIDAFVTRRPVGCDSDGNEHLWLNDGTGNFSDQPNFPGDGREDVGLVVGDFDGNGTNDVFAIPNNSCTAGSLWTNKPLGVWTRADVAAIGCSGNQRSIAMGDLNGDGWPDIYVAVSGLDYIYVNQGDGGFKPSRTLTAKLADGGTGSYAFPFVNDDSVAVCIADYDKNGLQDVFVVNRSNQQASYYLQGPPGNFTLSNTLIPVVGGNGTGCVAGQLRPGSGATDIVVVKDGQIYQYLTNNGFGTFTDETTGSTPVYHLPPNPPDLNIGDVIQTGWGGNDGRTRGIVISDINNDGFPDLIMDHYNQSPPLQVYLNDGTGFFSLATAGRIPSRADAGSPPQGDGLFPFEWWQPADLNSDGKVDMILTSDNQSRLLLQQGSGALQYATMKSIPETNYCAIRGVNFDFNKSGTQGLALATGCTYNPASGEPAGCRGNTVRIWQNDGAGGYSDATATHFPAFNRNAISMAYGDVNGDGLPDLIVGTGGENPTGTGGDYAVRLYLNTPGGVFTDGTYPRIPYESFEAIDVLLVDVNKDGFLDIVSISPQSCNFGCSSGSIHMYLNTGTGYFLNVNTQLPYTTFPGSNVFGPERAASADFNGDGYPDLYIAGLGQNHLFLNQGLANPGFFNDVTNSNIPSVGDNSYDTFAGDLNGDGFADVFICNGSTGGGALKRIDLGNSNGVLSDVTATNWPGEGQTYPYPSVCGGTISPLNSQSCAVGDVNGDGLPDVVLGNADDSNIFLRTSLYVNIGGAYFQDSTAASLPFDSDQTFKVLLYPANGDAKPDLFLGNCGQQRVYLQQ